MIPSLCILALTGAAFASEVTITWINDKGSESSALVVKEGDKTVAVGCGSVLKTASSSLDFSKLDTDGNGNFTVGSNNFMVHSLPEFSGGPQCTTIYDDVITVNECKGVDLDTSAFGKSDVEDVVQCFQNAQVQDKAEGLMSALGGPQAQKAEAMPHTHVLGDPTWTRTKLESRQPCSIYFETHQVGNGNPHQNWYHKQLSDRNFCGAAPDCSVSYSVGTTTDWSASATISYWISGSFTGAVSRSWSASTTYTCGGRTGDTICSWHNQAHTAYTVQNIGFDTCTGRPIHYGGNIVLWSPNVSNRGGGFYCVVGTCRYINDNWWDYSPRQPGGPR